MYIFDDSSSIFSIIAAGSNLFTLRIMKQPVFGSAESWQKYSTHGYKKVLFINYRCEKGRRRF